MANFLNTGDRKGAIFGSLLLIIFFSGGLPEGSAQTGPDSLWSIETVLMDKNADDTVDYLGEEVRVTGIANTSSGVFHESYLQSFIQNEERGLSIFSKEMVGPTFGRGDSLVVRGEIQHYQGLDEIHVWSYEVFPKATRELAPKSLLKAMSDPERYIGMLVEGEGTIIEKGTVYNGKYLRITSPDHTGTPLMVYVSNFHKHYKKFDFDILSIGDQISIQGVMGKYNPEFPDEGAYQIMLRDPGDLEYAGFPRLYWYSGAGGLMLIMIFVGVWILMLRRQVNNKTTQIQKSLDEKEELLREKQILLKEIHHRVKNNLSIISGLIGLQLDNTDDDTAQDVLKDSQSRIQSMALVHDKLYQTESLSDISLDVYLKELVEALHSTFTNYQKAVDLKFDLDSVSLDIDSVIPCGLLVNELVVNAFKHAFNKDSGGVLEVKLKARNGRIELLVADNGPGVGDDFSIDSGDSLGFMLIQTFTAQLGAEIEIKREREGAAFKFSFSQ